MNIETVVYQQLKHLGVPVSLSGYSYLQEAIVRVLEDPSLIRKVTIKLYPDIAKKYDTLASRVERSIRHAIEHVYSNTDEDIIAQYFGNTINLASGKLTNIQFIAGIAEYIKMEVRA